MKTAEISYFVQLAFVIASTYSLAQHSTKLEYGPMPNVMVILPNIGGAAKFGSRPLPECRVVTMPRRKTR